MITYKWPASCFCLLLLVLSGLLTGPGCSDHDHDEVPPPTATPQPFPDQTRFTRTYGGTNFDEGTSVLVLDNGDYLIGGTTRSFGSGETDFYLIRTDFFGDELWSWHQTYGGPESDSCQQVIETIDQAFLLLGSTSSFGAGLSDVLLLKVDNQGALMWSRTYGGAGFDWASAIHSDNNGYYYIVGYTNSHTGDNADIYVLKIDEDGDVVWSLTLGGDSGDFGFSLDLTVNGDILVTGGTWSYGEGYEDIIVYKVSSEGTVLWQQTYGGPFSDRPYSIQSTADGGAIICGETWPWLNDIFLLKIDAQAHEVWTMTYGGDHYDWGHSVRQTADHGYILCCTTSSFGAGEDDILVLKTDENGQLEWSRTCGGPGCETGYSIEAALDGGYVVTGSTNSYGAGDFDVFLIKTDALGYSSP